MKKLPALIICLAAALSCNRSEYIPEFLTDDTVRLEIFGSQVFVFDPLT